MMETGSFQNVSTKHVSQEMCPNILSAEQCFDGSILN